MDMTKDFLNRILELDNPNEIEYAGRKFVDKHMTALPREITANSLKTSTLSSIVDYIKSGVDNNAIGTSRFVIHVEGYGCVQLYKELNIDKERENLISAEIDNCHFPFGQFMPVENFIINLQSLFVQNEHTKALLEFVSSVKDDTAVQQNDDGITQSVVVNRGVSLARSVPAPNPVYLKPFRTFSEVDQPESAFVFRIKKDDRYGVTAALYEADGAAWKHDVILEIKEYFEENLKGQSAIILA